MLLVGTIGFRSEGQERKGGGGLTGEARSGDGVQKVNVGEASVVGDGEEEVDHVQTATASSKL
jgi:hypothetical protein